MSVTKFRDLRNFTFNELKLIEQTGLSSFDFFLRELSQNKCLERIEFKKLPDLKASDCQDVLYDVLKTFNSLKIVNFESEDLILTKSFYDNVSKLTNLHSIILNLKKFDIDLFKDWSTSGLIEVRQKKEI
jgi:hypothetical protein